MPSAAGLLVKASLLGVVAAKHIAKAFFPTVLCSLLVLLSAATKKPPKLQHVRHGEALVPTVPPLAWWAPFKSDVLWWDAIRNCGIMLIIVVCVAAVFACLYKHRFYRVLYVWLMLTVGTIISVFFGKHFHAVCDAFDVPIDWPSVLLLYWNIAVGGLVMLFWKGPLMVQQAYAIMFAAVAATTMSEQLPDLTSEFVLVFLAIWDMITVLAPFGPLKKIFSIAHERGEDGDLAAAVVYRTSDCRSSAAVKESSSDDHVCNSASSEALSHACADAERFSSDTAGLRQRKRQAISSMPPANKATVQTDMEDVLGLPLDIDESFSVGLGDLVCFAMLVANAAKHDAVCTLIVFVGISVGFCAKLLLIAMFKRVLPALPMFVFIGSVFHVVAVYCSSPMLASFARAQRFI